MTVPAGRSKPNPAEKHNLSRSEHNGYNKQRLRYRDRDALRYAPTATTSTKEQKRPMQSERNGKEVRSRPRPVDPGLPYGQDLSNVASSSTPPVQRAIPTHPTASRSKKANSAEARKTGDDINGSRRPSDARSRDIRPDAASKKPHALTHKPISVISSSSSSIQIIESPKKGVWF